MDQNQANQNDPNQTPAAGTIRSLARAVVHAANLGAGVINISEAACFKVRKPVSPPWARPWPTRSTS